MSSHQSIGGFTLLETVIATGILVTALAGVAQLFVLGTHLTRQATVAGAALVSAQDKLETLRGLPFSYDAAGMAITDPSLAISPSNTLADDVPRYVDFVNAQGEAVDRADAAAFTRRWRVSSIDTASPPAIAIEVCVFTPPATANGADACLSTIRSRQP